MKSRISIIPVLAVTVLTCCTTLRRYNSAGQEEIDNSLADAELFGFTLTRTEQDNPRKTIWDLSADAQAQYIKILNTRYPENDKFLQAMNFRYLNDESPAPGSGDFVGKDLRMIFSISRKHDCGSNTQGLKISPADRIEYIKLTLAIPENKGIKFTGWNMFATEYGSIEIGGMSFSRNLEINVGGLLSSEAGESEGEISAKAGSSRGTKEEQEIRYRFLKLNGRLKNNMIQIEEEGTRETDLTGNLIADISIEFEKFPVMLTRITNLQDSEGKFNIPEKLNLSNSYVFVPRMVNPVDTITADLSMDYLFRHVVRGHKTFPEWDDRIRYYKGSVSRRVTLFSSAEYMPGFYCIGRSSGDNGFDIIKMAGQDKREMALIFSSLEEANSFYSWLSNILVQPGNEGRKITPCGYTLRYGGEDVTGGSFDKYDGTILLPYYR